MAVQPGGEKAQDDLIHAQKSLTEGNEEDGARFFSVVPTDNGHKLKKKKKSEEDTILL